MSLALLLAGAALIGACKTEAPAPEQPPATQVGEPQTEGQKTAYALGVMVGRNLTPLKLNPEELEMVELGLEDAAQGREPKVDLEAYGPKIQEMAQNRAVANAQAEKEKSKSFLEQAAAEEGAVKLPSGLIITTVEAGTGKSPKPKDVVKVHYQGTLTDGTEFDSSLKRGQPVEFPLDGVIGCWTEGLQQMKVGGKARLVCPSDIAYGDQGRPPVIPGGATLIFQVELLEIKKK
jgi:FKBP-type peptidyl-prolyl cis-trans isomerase FkpA